MEHDEIYLIDLWRIVLREWRWFVAALAAVLLLTAIFLGIAKPKWEAVAAVQVGQVSTMPSGVDPKVEPLQRVVDRVQTRSFEDAVTARAGYALNSREAALFRASFKQEPSYSSILVKLTVRGYSAEQARRSAQAAVDELKAVHENLQAAPLREARARMAEIDAALQHALADRERLLQQAAGKDPQAALVASSLLATTNSNISALQQARGELATRLMPGSTFVTSLAWPITVSIGPVFPNRVLTLGMGWFFGLFLGGLAAIARNALRRRAVARSFQPKPASAALT